MQSREQKNWVQESVMETFKETPKDTKTQKSREIFCVDD